MKGVGIAVLIVALIAASVSFKWWRCGEMFPHAQFACFVGGK